MIRVLITDQFAGPTPYALQRSPMLFDQLCAEMLAQEPALFNPTRVLDVDEDFVPARCTSIWRADEHGYAVLWKYQWDTSG